MAEPAAWLLMLALVAIFVILSLKLRDAAGPFHIWHTLDASYYYLFDALNLAEGFPPGHIPHPGLPADLLAALVLKAKGLGAEAVLADPEDALRLLSNGAVALVGGSLFLAMLAAWLWVRRLSAVILMGIAPLVSMVALKMLWHVKPEPVVFAAALLACLPLLRSFRHPGTLERASTAVVLGLLGAVMVTAKWSALPLLVIPFLCLRGWRPKLWFVVSGMLGGGLLLAPAWGELDWVFGYLWSLIIHADAHGGGAETVADWAAYPGTVIKILRRPILLLPVVLGLLFACWGTLRRVRGGEVDRTAIRLAFAGGSGLLIMALAVAKQPVAYYLVPAFVFSVFTLVAVCRVVASFGWGGDGLRRTVGAFLVLALLGLAGAQVGAANRQAEEYSRHRDEALLVEDGRFAACRRLFLYGASSPDFALLLGSYLTGNHFADRVAERIGPDRYWADDYYPFDEDKGRDARGPVALAEVLAAKPCLVISGFAWRDGWRTVVQPALAGREPTATCSWPMQRAVTYGIDCEGRLVGDSVQSGGTGNERPQADDPGKAGPGL
ncbi:MAG: hypothetical protein ACPGNT_03270 [Rhodospirillales bacterium]